MISGIYNNVFVTETTCCVHYTILTSTVSLATQLPASRQPAPPPPPDLRACGQLPSSVLSMVDKITAADSPVQHEVMRSSRG